jgi:GTP cyclohydrolase I
MLGTNFRRALIQSAVEKEAIEKAVRTILQCIGEDPDREGLRETPSRVAKMYAEIYSGCRSTNDELIQEFGKTFSEEESESIEKFGDMVIVKDIPFYSTCEHHLVPFHGKISVGYIPNDKIIGLSKIARLAEAISKRPQVQERITKDIAECMDRMLDPVGVMVVIEAEHLCMSMRGVKKPGSKTVTSATRGVFRTDSATRSEFLQLVRN